MKLIRNIYQRKSEFETRMHAQQTEIFFEPLSDIEENILHHLRKIKILNHPGNLIHQKKIHTLKKLLIGCWEFSDFDTTSV